MRRLLVLLALMPITIARVISAQNAPLTSAAVRAARAASNAAITARDTITLASLVTPSYHSVSSRNAHSSGRSGEGERWRQQFMAHPDVSYVRTPVSIRLFTPWQMAEETGTWVGRWTDADGRVDIRGGYVAKWRRIEGRWLLEAEVFTPTSCRGSVYCTTAPPQPATP